MLIFDLKERINKIEANTNSLIEEKSDNDIKTDNDDDSDNESNDENNHSYPIDLFDNLTIESIKLIEKYWKYFIRSNKKFSEKYDPDGYYSVENEKAIKKQIQKENNLISPKNNKKGGNLSVDSNDQGDSDTDYDE